MKKIINGKLYDTSTAKATGCWEYSNRGDFAYMRETLYWKKTGEFFLHGEGGAMSKYARCIGQNEWSGGDEIIPLDYISAQKWGEKHLSADEYEEIFGPVPEGDDGKISATIRLPQSLHARIKRGASRTGKTISDYIAEIVNSAIQ